MCYILGENDGGNQVEGIQVNNLKKEFEYYRKAKGLSGSIKNMFHREKLIKQAVKDVSFCIEKGEMVGLLGANGAGKTTTLKMLSGILFPTSGEALVAGFVPWERKNEYKRRFSIVMGQKNQLWWDLPANETFILNKRLYDVPDESFDKIVAELSELLDVKNILDVQVRRLSLGERMKMELMAALIHGPEILFLDEPTIGLDLVSQRKIRDFLKFYNEQTKTTTILTSHYTKDIEDLCQRAIIINSGTVVYDGELAKMNQLLGSKKLLTIRCNEDIDLEKLRRYGKIREAGMDYATIEVEKEHINQYSIDMLSQFPVIDFTVMDIPLEESIEKFYQKDVV